MSHAEYNNHHHHHHHNDDHHHHYQQHDVDVIDRPEEDLARTVRSGSESTPSCPLSAVKQLEVITIIINTVIIITVIIIVNVFLTIIITNISQKTKKLCITCGPCVRLGEAEWPYVQDLPVFKLCLVFLCSRTTCRPTGLCLNSGLVRFFSLIFHMLKIYLCLNCVSVKFLSFSCCMFRIYLCTCV